MTETVRLPTRLSALRGALSALLTEQRWSGEPHGVLTAVQEAVANAARHGRGVREVTAAFAGEELVVEVADHGNGFDPAGYLAEPPDPLAEAGRGLWIMAQLASTVEIGRDLDGARLRLRFGAEHVEPELNEEPTPPPRLGELGMEPLEALGGAALIVDARSLVREVTGPVEALLGVAGAELPGRDMRGVVADAKHRFAEPESYETAVLDLLAHPERAAEDMFLLDSGQFLRQHVVPLRKGASVVGRMLVLTPASGHTESLAAFQRALLPTLPAADGVDLGAVYHPAEVSGLVGGDFYDVFDLPAGRCVVVGDVSGRGPQAAAAGVTARAYLRATLSTGGVTGAVSSLNEALVGELAVEQFVTMAMATRESADVWALVLCGHPPPLLLRDGHVVQFRSGDLLLGLSGAQQWARQLFHLHRGDVLLLYTDGVTEAGPATEPFGSERLVEALTDLGDYPPQRLVEAIDTRLHSFAGGHLADDHVLLAVART